jgi:N-acetylglucosamine kinase-like BadF-type ATPase
MKYAIGIDGGGTGSTLKIFSEDSVEVGGAIGGPANISAQPAGEVKSILDNLINAGLANAKVHIKDIAAICIGAAGAGRERDASILKEIIADIGIKGTIIIKEDTHIALVAGTGKEEGIIVIAGTGSIAYGRTMEGKSSRAGGWGHIIGDEGSAYYIGVKAINEALRSYDGRSGFTILLPMLLEAMQADNVDQLVSYVYREEFSKSKIAKLARVVDEAFKKGDQTAKSILEQSAYELFLLADSVIKALDTTDSVLVTSGSVLLKNKFIFDNFCSLVKASYPKLRILKLNKDPAYGAVHIALKYL